MIFEEKDSDQVDGVLFFDAVVDRLDEDYIYISTIDDNDHYNEERFPVGLVQSWQYRPYRNEWE